jgi:soluble lytic murein transglycosylase-like protein
MGYTKAQLKQLKYNLKCGIRFYKDNYNRFKNERNALAYYNGGSYYHYDQAQGYATKVLTIKKDLLKFVKEI